MLLNWVSRACACLAMVGVLAAGSAWAEDATPVTEEAAQVEFFAAIESGDIDVKFVPRNSKQAMVVITNNTKQPLNVKLPEGFAGVPVLAQFGGGMGGMGMGGGMGGMQAMGGGMGGMGMGGMGGMGMGGMGGMGGGGGFFHVEPEKAAKIKVECVCLEHGKKEPNASAKYKMVPLESFTSNAEVAEVLKMLARREIDQTSAQVAIWHLANGMSFEQLAAKRIRRANGAIVAYFEPANIYAGMKIVSVAAFRAQQSKKQDDKSDSLSQR